MRNGLWVLALVLVAAAVVAQDKANEVKGARSAEAVEILRQVEAALDGVEAVRLRARAVPGGAAVSFLSPAEGTAVMSGWNSMIQMPKRFWVNVTTQRRGSDEVVELTSGGDGESYFIVDHGTKKAYEDIDPAVLGSNAMILRQFGISNFVQDEPMQAEMNAVSVTLGEAEKIGSEECHAVEVDFGAQGRVTWYIAKSDHLPRRQVQYFSMGTAEGSLDSIRR